MGFGLKWKGEGGDPEEDEKQGIASIKYVLTKEKPELIEKYQRVEKLSPDEINSLKEEIYKITLAHFNVWGLSGAMNGRNTPYFGGSHIAALDKVFHELGLNPLGFGLKWKGEGGDPEEDEKQGIASIKYVLAKEKPELIEKYQRVEKLSPDEINSLREEIYKITSGHFNVWGLSGAMNKTMAPYFGGSHTTVLDKVFHKLGLNPLGFGLKWKGEGGDPEEDKNLGIASIKYVLAKEKPELIEKYQRVEKLSPDEINSLREEIYKITRGHFNVWGLGGAMIKNTAPYFGGSYMTALLKVFDHSRLNLTEQGFKDYRKNHWEIKYSWGGKTGIHQGIENVRDAIEKNMPELLQKYQNLNQLREEEKEKLREEIYKITQGHFQAWGLGRAMDGREIPYFGGSYITALDKVFHKLGLNPLRFELKWKGEGGDPEEDEKLGIKSVRYVLAKEKPELIEKYQRVEELFPDEINSLKEEIYKITRGHLKVWGLSGAINKTMTPYFGGSHITALDKVFHKLGLNPLGFELKWKGEGGDPEEDEKLGIKSVRYVLAKEKPELIEKYQRVEELFPDEINSLKEEIYKITRGHLKVWGLSGAINKTMTPYFGGSHITALDKVFHKLGLNPLGFELKWKGEGGDPEGDKNLGIASVKYVLAKEKPELIEKYQRVEKLSPDEINSLREEIYKITSGHFNVWGLSGAMDGRNAPYFGGSYITVLLKVFDHPELELKREGFIKSVGFFGWGRITRALTDLEIKFRNQLSKKLQNELKDRFPSRYAQILAETMVRLRDQSLHLLQEHGVLLKSEVQGIGQLDLNRLNVPELADRLAREIQLYQSKGLSETEVELLLSTHLLPWSYIEQLQRVYRLGDERSLIIQSLNTPNVEDWIKRKREAEEKRGTLDREKHLKRYNSQDMEVLKIPERQSLIRNLKTRLSVLQAILAHPIPQVSQGTARVDSDEEFTDSSDLPTKIQIEHLQRVIDHLERSQGHSTGSRVLDRLFGLIPLTSQDRNSPNTGLSVDEFFNKGIPYRKISNLESIGDQSQEEAVNLALNPTEAFYIEGPAGTGKTTVIEEIIRQYVKLGKNVLVVSQMNQAVDNALAKVMDDLPALRFGGNPKRLEYGVEKVWVGNKETGLRKEVLDEFQKRNINGTGMVFAGTNIGIETNPFFRNIIQRTGKFDLVIMDEASRETLSAALVPLSYLKDDGKVIFVGDTKQLPPFGLNNEEERALKDNGVSEDEIKAFNTSVFDWLLERSYGDRVMLSTNYRSHPLISGLVSHLFYEGDVHRRGWEDFDAQTLSLKVIDINEGINEYYEERVGSSFRNPPSADEAMFLILYHNKIKGIPLKEITVITPYLPQVELIRSLIQKEYPTLTNGDLPTITTIDSYQGGENSAVIFDFVRSNPQGQIGFVKDLRRLNVGLSRAKDNLAIIWDSRTFTEEPKERDTLDDERAKALFKSLKEYYKYEVRAFFPESGEIEDEANSIGGIIPVVKEWAMNLSKQIHLLTHKKIPLLSSRNYGRWFSSPFENTFAYFVSLLVGLPMYLSTGDFTLSLTASYLVTWSYTFIATHFIPDSKGIRAPPINIGLAGLISVVNLSLPYLVPHILPYILPHTFAASPLLVIPTSILASYITHFAVNILANYFKELKLYKESEKELKEFLMVRKAREEHPLSNLTYSLIHKALFRSKVKEEYPIFLVDLNGLVKETKETVENKIEAEMDLRKALEGARDRLMGEKNPRVRLGFIMKSDKIQGIVKTLLTEYGIPEYLVLFSVQTQKQALEKSKGYKIALVVTAFPELWRKFAKDLLNLGEKIAVSGTFARELKSLIENMGYTEENGVEWNWMKNELTIQEKNPQTKDLENFSTSETFEIQA